MRASVTRYNELTSRIREHDNDIENDENFESRLEEHSEYLQRPKTVTKARAERNSRTATTAPQECVSESPPGAAGPPPSLMSGSDWADIVSIYLTAKTASSSSTYYTAELGNLAEPCSSIPFRQASHGPVT